jgi:hypothetical protein
MAVLLSGWLLLGGWLALRLAGDLGPDIGDDSRKVNK